MIIYFDTSALIKRYIREDRSEEVIALMNGTDVFCGSAAVTQVEMAAAMQKAVRISVTSSEIASIVWREFLDHWLSFTRLAVSSRTIERASDIAWRNKLRGYDSIQLASAMIWQETLQTPIVFATFDRDLWSAGKQAGLGVWPENLVP